MAGTNTVSKNGFICLRTGLDRNIISLIIGLIWHGSLCDDEFTRNEEEYPSELNRHSTRVRRGIYSFFVQEISFIRFKECPFPSLDGQKVPLRLEIELLHNGL